MKRFDAKTVAYLTIPALLLFAWSLWLQAKTTQSPTQAAEQFVLRGYLLSPHPLGPTPSPLSVRQSLFEDRKLRHDVIGFGVRFEPVKKWRFWGSAKEPITYRKCYGIKVFDRATGTEMKPFLNTGGSMYYFESWLYKASQLRNLPQGIVVKAPVGWSKNGKSHFEPLQLTLSRAQVMALPEGMENL